jgi:hypothetical protein
MEQVYCREWVPVSRCCHIGGSVDLLRLLDSFWSQTEGWLRGRSSIGDLKWTQLEGALRMVWDQRNAMGKCFK